MGTNRACYTIVGDPHVKPNNLDTFHKLTSKVEELGNHTVWLGDLLDTKEVIRGRCLNTCLEYFMNSKLQHTVLVGNHDWFNLECKEHSLEFLKMLDNVAVVDSLIQNVAGFAFIPYIHDKETLKKTLKEASDSKILFAHLEVSNFDFGNGYICDEGLDLKDLSKFKKVISGHFHKFQQQGNLTYLGTPFSHSFGESNQTKYIATINEEGVLDLIETGFPKHVTIEFNCDNLNDTKDHVLIPEIFDDPKKPLKDYYRVILTGKQENVDRFPKHMYNKIDIKWIERPSDSIVSGLQISDTQSNETQFSEWAEKVADLDKDTIKLGVEILRSVNG